ncbi:MAG: glutathione S-transferase family protein [Gammaproteobacteria bacterium]|nr:glutathione S-transferase family protein [Gammaproteobacteria bacterium]
MKIYGDIQSGNCYKIKLLADLMNLGYQWIHVDILAGETHTADFLSKNPNGKIPMIVLDDGRVLSESNAILNYLANDSKFLPDDKYQRALVLQWQFFEQYSHEPFIAVARYINKYLGLPEERRTEYESKQAGGHKALKVMEQQLGTTTFFVGDDLTIADISLYAYTHVAGEGGFELSNYPAISAWIKRIESYPGYTGMSL